MNRRAGVQGIGRIDMVEDRLVGIKSREIYEAPGAVALIEAHQALESITLERMQHRYKRQLEQTWGELVYEAQWYSPLKKSMDAFIEHTQEYVSGDIRMILHGGRATVNGRRSESSLYDFNLATYETGDTSISRRRADSSTFMACSPSSRPPATCARRQYGVLSTH